MSHLLEPNALTGVVCSLAFLFYAFLVWRNGGGGWR